MDEKKKFIVLGVLVVVILAVGAFQFIGKSSGAPTTAETPAQETQDEVVAVEDTDTPSNTPTETEENTEDEAANAKNPQLVAALAQRDPFQQLAPVGSSLPQPPAPRPQPQPQPQPQPRRTPPPSDIDKGNVPFMPGVGDLSGGIGPGGVTIEPQFNYQLTGVIVGAKPAAVFKDPQGGQRLVPLGGSIDGDSSVIGITSNRVTVRFMGKTLTLSLGGSPSAN